jgi:hypothetical protein
MISESETRNQTTDSPSGQEIEKMAFDNFGITPEEEEAYLAAEVQKMLDSDEYAMDTAAWEAEAEDREYKN